MKKSLKKLLCLMMVVVLAMAFVACGSDDDKKDEDVNAGSADKLSTEQLLEKIATSTTEVKGISISGDIDLGLKLSMSGQEAEMAFNGTLEAKSSTDPKASYAKGEFGYDVLGQTESATFESYSVLNGDVMEVYSNEDGEWSYEEEELSDYSDFVEDFQSAMEDFDYSKIKDYCSELTSDLEDGDYTIVAKVDSKEIMELAEEAGADTSSLGVDISAIPEFELIFTIVVDAEKYLPKSISLALDMDEFEMEGATYELTKCVIEFNVDSYDAVTIEVPEEALSAKTE